MEDYFQSVNPYYRERVSEKKIYSRAGYLESAFDMLIKSYKDNGRQDLVKGININRSILLDITSSYYYDVERLKHFHNIERIDGYKIAGLMIKWITKLRPIYISYENFTEPEPEFTKFHSLCNQVFALRVGLSMAEISINKIPKITQHKLIYHFTYREIDEDMLFILLEAVNLLS